MEQNTKIAAGSVPAPTNNPANHLVKFRSSDRLVEVVVKGAGGAKRYPDHTYQVVCLRLFPQAGTRIQEIEGGGLDVLFTHVEVAALLSALNSVDGKAQYKWTQVPEKPVARKAFWAQVNAQRRAERLDLKKAA
jgi:hypothetical protein